MMKKMFSIWQVSLLLVLPELSFAAKYEVVDLGVVEGGNLSFAYDLNDAGQVAGSINEIPSDDPSDDTGGCAIDDSVISATEFLKGALYTGGAWQTLGVLPLDFDEDTLEQISDAGITVDSLSSEAYGLNESGMLVGFSEIVIQGTVTIDEEEQTVFGIDRQATLFDGTTLTALEMPDGAACSVAVKINDNGVIAGHAFRVLSATLDDESTVTSIVRRAWTYDTNAAEPFSYVPTAVKEEIPDDDDIDRSSSVSDINDDGIVVGVTDSFDLEFEGDRRGYYYAPGSEAGPVSIGAIADRIHSSANAINDQNVIAGNAFNSVFDAFGNELFFQSRGMIYNIATGETTDIGSLNSEFDNTVAHDINDTNQVVGFSTVGERNNTDRNAAFIYDANNGMIDLNTMIDCNSGWELLEARAINNAGQISGTGFFNFTNSDGEEELQFRAFLLNPAEGDAIQDCEVESRFGGESESGSTDFFLLIWLLSILGLQIVIVRK